jgi:ribosome-associated translation inhibitor RaiA
MRRAFSVERGTSLNGVIDRFRENEEVIIVGNNRPMGIITPKDALELTLPKHNDTSIHLAHLEDFDARREIEDQMKKFVTKIQGKLESIQNVIVYADKHKTRKYSLRARIITENGVIYAKGVGYDPITACKELITRLDRQIKTEHGHKLDKKHQGTVRTSDLIE